jgi:heat-inducible transcriptional repressor
MVMPSKSRRQWEVLEAVVRLYIETGRPVSSGLVTRDMRRAYSSATVRSVMTQLEDACFLTKPHTSSGRVPTDTGYRVFVDRLLLSWPLQQWELPISLQKMVQDNLSRTVGSVAMVSMLANLLSRLTANISIILGPAWDDVKAVRVDLYPKENRRILMVLVLDNALVRTCLLTFPQDYPRPVLVEAARILSERVFGRTVAEIRQSVLSSLDASASLADRCASDLARSGRELFLDVEEGDIELEGVSHVLDEPEFSDPVRLKSLIRFLESPRAIREALKRLSRQTKGGFGVWIGSENPIGELRSFSLLSSSFDLAGRRGVLAVLGPRRMPYQRAISSLDTLRRTIKVLAS